MKTKLEILAALATLIGTLATIYVLFFGDNIYQQKTGQSIYHVNPTYTVETPLETTTATPVSNLSIPTSNIGEPTVTLEPNLTSTEDVMIIPASLPTEITDTKGVSMRLVPAGEFTMGSNDGNAGEKPAQTVYLPVFYMDKYEVSNAFYKVCAVAGICKIPVQTSSYTRSSYYNNHEYDNYPVIYVDWNMAKAYCEWRGSKLPTEAEWEKSARGIDGRTYPWGEELKFSFANYGQKDTTEVGKYENGKSPYGIYDMAGNVWEWVADWFDVYPGGDPHPKTGFYGFGQYYRVFRGGSYQYYAGTIRVWVRSSYIPESNRPDLGFRCARSVP